MVSERSLRAIIFYFLVSSVALLASCQMTGSNGQGSTPSWGTSYTGELSREILLIPLDDANGQFQVLSTETSNSSDATKLAPGQGILAPDGSSVSGITFGSLLDTTWSTRIIHEDTVGGARVVISPALTVSANHGSTLATWNLSRGQVLFDPGIQAAISVGQDTLPFWSPAGGLSNLGFRTSNRDVHGLLTTPAQTLVLLWDATVKSTVLADPHSALPILGVFKNLYPLEGLILSSLGIEFAAYTETVLPSGAVNRHFWLYRFALDSSGVLIPDTAPEVLPLSVDYSYGDIWLCGNTVRRWLCSTSHNSVSLMDDQGGMVNEILNGSLMYFRPVILPDGRLVLCPRAESVWSNISLPDTSINGNSNVLWPMATSANHLYIASSSDGIQVDTWTYPQGPSIETNLITGLINTSTGPQVIIVRLNVK